MWTPRWDQANRSRLVRSLAGSMLLGIVGSGYGHDAGADPLSDPRIDQAIEAVQSGQEDPRNLRTLIKEKVSGKEQEKSLPKASGGSTRRRRATRARGLLEPGTGNRAQQAGPVDPIHPLPSFALDESANGVYPPQALFRHKR